MGLWREGAGGGMAGWWDRRDAGSGGAGQAGDARSGELNLPAESGTLLRRLCQIR
jgi:hypothetical protein